MSLDDQLKTYAGELSSAQEQVAHAFAQRDAKIAALESTRRECEAALEEAHERTATLAKRNEVLDSELHIARVRVHELECEIIAHPFPYDYSCMSIWFDVTCMSDSNAC